MNNDKPKSKHLIIKMILAWLTVVGIGIISLIISFSFASLNDPTRTPIITGVLIGMLFILILLNLSYRQPQGIYFSHLRFGLFIGLLAYGLLLLPDAANMHPLSLSQPEVSPSSTCTSPFKQYNEYGSAIVPISTNLGRGTGFAVNDEYTVLTAYHVIERASFIFADYSSGRVRLEVIEIAPQYDLALLKIAKPTGSFFTLSESYTTGDQVLAYGYPGTTFAGPPSLSTGIVSRVLDIESLRMNFLNTAEGLELIQTDAAINPGNSGGPLLSACGVIGIVSFVSDTNGLHRYTGSVSEQNIGFAISSKTAKAAFPQYLAK